MSASTTIPLTQRKKSPTPNKVENEEPQEQEEDISPPPAVIKKRTAKIPIVISSPASPKINEDESSFKIKREEKVTSKEETSIPKEEKTISREEKTTSKEEKVIPSETKVQRVKKISTSTSNFESKLKNMGITVLYILSINENENIIMAMTPLGTIIGINLKEHISPKDTNYITMKSVHELLQINPSWLTHIGNKTDLSTIVICKDGICTLQKGVTGKLETRYYQLTSSKLSGEITTNDTPTAYPLVNMKDIEENYSIVGKNNTKLTFDNYIEFLENIKEEADKLNNEQINHRIHELERNISFMESLLVNITEIKNKIVDFNTANNIETESKIKEAKQLLEKKMTTDQFSESDARKWKSNQEKLSGLSFNEISIVNGMKKYNKFSDTLKQIDRETFQLYFTLYNRVVTTMENNLNRQIREPETWNLQEVLPQTNKSLSQKNVSIETLNEIIASDLSKYDPTAHNEQTNILMSHFGKTFQK